MTTDLTPETLAELERLEREATPGEWLWDEKRFVVTTTHTPDPRYNPEAIIVTDCEFYPPEENDRNFIIALRNAAPQLLAELRASRERERRYYVALCEIVARDDCDIARAALREGEKL